MSSPATSLSPTQASIRPRRRLVVGLVLLALVGSTGGGVAFLWYRSRSPDRVFARGEAALRDKSEDQVVSCIERLEALGESERANYLRGSLLIEQHRYDQALRTLNRIRGDKVSRVEVAARAARCLLELKELREAFRTFSWVLEQDPEHLDANRGMAAISYDLGNLTATQHHMEIVARQANWDGRPHMLMGKCSYYMGKSEDAEAHFREALRRELSHTFRRSTQLELAECLVRRTQYAEALEILDRRLESGEPEDLASMALRGECLWGLGKLTEARTLLDLALAEHPQDPQLWCLSGQVHLARKERDRAVADLEKAVARSPRDYRCCYQLQLAYAAANRRADTARMEARTAHLRDVMERLSSKSMDAMRKPWDPDIRMQLAELCEQVDNPKLATMWREAARACRSRTP